VCVLSDARDCSKNGGRRKGREGKKRGGEEKLLEKTSTVEILELRAGLLLACSLQKRGRGEFSAFPDCWCLCTFSGNLDWLLLKHFV
jgi:hypothetical protein